MPDFIPDDLGQQLLTTNDFLADLITRRGKKQIGSNSVRAVELMGGKIIEPTAFEPDPNTYRGEYYYNAITNVLYRKVVVRTDPVLVATWRKASD
jgi:hypothetical protein